MKTQIPLLAVFLFFNSLQGQTMRYFEVVMALQPGGDWRDTAYVVAASDPALLAEIEYELTKPLEQRRHINSPIAAGNGGFNHNATTWYSWHSKPNEWTFAEVSAEVCDGLAYTHVEADTGYWIGTVGYFCGWTYQLAREINAPVSAPEPGEPLADFLPVVPNPADEEVLFTWSQTAAANVELNVTDASGRLSVTLPLGSNESGQHTKSFATAALSKGIYFATLRIGNRALTQRFVVAH